MALIDRLMRPREPVPDAAPPCSWIDASRFRALEKKHGSLAGKKIVRGWMGGFKVDPDGY